MITKDLAIKILEYLNNHNMAFCFYEGSLISVEMCEEVISK